MFYKIKFNIIASYAKVGTLSIIQMEDFWIFWLSDHERVQLSGKQSSVELYNFIFIIELKC